jgi:uncharacterized membrane protein
MLFRPVSWVVAVAVGLMAASAPMQFALSAVDFAHQIVPLIRKHCATCHAAAVTKDLFRLTRAMT